MPFYTKSSHKIIIVLIVAVLVPSFAFAQGNSTNLPAVPETIGDAMSFLLQVIKATPGAIIDVFGEAIKIFAQIIKWAWAQWDKYVWPQIERLWQKLLGLFGKEVEKRKPIIQQELEKEKQELRQEIQQQTERAGQSLWERFKDLIRNKL